MQIDPADTHAMIAATAPRRPREPWLRLLAAVLRLAGDQAELLRHSERPWSSATFTGSRHTIALTFSGAAAQAAGEAFIAALPEHEFTLPGQFVADAAVVAVDQVTRPEPALTIEAALLLVREG